MPHHKKIITEKNQELIQFSVDHASDAIFWTDKKANFLFVNQAATTRLGYPKEELLSMNVHDIDPNFPAQKWPAHWKELKEKKTMLFESKHKTKEGSIIPVEITANYLEYRGEEYNFAFAKDITERKKSEEALAESGEKFRKLISATADVIWQTDENSQIIYVSPSIKSLMGFEPEEVLGRTLISFISPKEKEEAEKVIAKEISEKGRLASYECALACKDKSQKIFETSLTPISDQEGKLKGFFGICKDITQRKKTEEALRESEDRYRNIFENSLVGVYLSNEEGRFLSVNPASARIFGYDSPEELINSTTSIGTQIYADPKFRENKIKELIRDGGGSYLLAAKRKDGKKIWLMNYVKTIKTPDKKNLFDGVLVDITEKLKTDEALKASEERYRTLVDTQIESICRWLPDTTLTYANEQYCKSLGKTRGEIIGKKWIKLIPQDAQKKAGEFYKQLAEKPGTHRYEHKVEKSGGEIIWEEWIDSPIFNNNKKLVEFQSVGRDITERKKSEETIKNALKEKELLLKEIHHRVKNNLQIVSSLLNIQKEKLKDEDDMRVFSDSQNYIKSLALVHEKLYHTKDLSTIDFKEYVNSLSKHLVRSYGKKTRHITVAVEGDNLLLEVDKAATCGIIINELLTNSIKHAFKEKDAGTIRIKIDGRNGEAIISISDDGSGMPEEFNIESSGSLGLSLVNSMVKQLRGEIKIIRKKGTSFIISFKTDNN